MGSLIKETPWGEITATLEILDRFGVTRDNLTDFRGADPEIQKQVTRIFAEGLKVDGISLTISALPSPIFERNEHGHIVVEIEGLDLTGEQEVKRLEDGKYRVGNYAKSCFTSTKPDGYDTKHRLVAGQKHKIALVPHKEIKRDADRTTKGLQGLGSKYGYGKPLAGIIPRIRESVSDKQMEEMGFWYIVAFHDTIQDSDGNPCVLGARRDVGGHWVVAFWDKLGNKWGGGGASAFLVPAK